MTALGERAEPAIRTPDQRLRVFVSSTLGELAGERAAAREAIEQLRLAAVMFEAGARPHPPRALYRAYLEQSDVFVGIYWQRYGWVAPDMEVSGLEDEFRLGAGMPRLLYVKRPAPDMEPRLKEMLGSLQEAGAGESYRPFRDADELRSLLADDLALLLAERFAAPAAPARDEAFAAAPPAPVTRLVGRDDDVRDVAALLDGDRRLVTLTGTGGIGKTRLALAVLDATWERWDASAFVDLSAVTDPAHVLPAVATAVGASPEGREEPIDALARRLAGRDVLLALDNVEQVAAAAPDLARLLERCPRLRLLVTSRVVLRLRGEREWPVAPLSLPAEARDVAHSAAVELFVERARDVRPSFELDGRNAAAVVELCRRLDGLPLALELAAARLRSLTPEQVLDRLGATLDLAGGLADLPERQRALSATIEWSRALLDRPAQALFARLSAFAGPFTVEAAEAVCGWDGLDVVEALSTLVDHSLLAAAERADAEPAFRMLETVRAHAASGLDDDRDETFARMEAYLREVFETAAPLLHTHDQAQVCARLDAEVGNLLATLSWLVASGRPPGALLRAVGNAWVWTMVRPALRAMPDLRELVGASPAAGAMTARDWSAVDWLYGGILFSTGRYAEAVEHLSALMPTFREQLEPAQWAMILTPLAVARPYDPDGPAREELETAIGVLRASGEGGLGYALSHYGDLLLVDGDVAGARAALEEARAAAEAAGDVNLVAETRAHLALVELHAGRVANAREHLVVAVDRYRRLDHRDGLARCATAVAAAAFGLGDMRLAARLFGASAATREQIDLPAWPLVAELDRRVEALVREELGDAAYGAEAAAGAERGVVALLDEVLAP